MIEELEAEATHGEMAQRLLENPDFTTLMGAYENALHEQEELLNPLDAGKFTALRAARRGVMNFRTFLESEKSGGEMARAKLQTGDTGKVIRMS